MTNQDGTIEVVDGLPESPHGEETHEHPVPADDVRSFELADALGTGLTCGSDEGACTTGRTSCLGGQVLCVGDTRPTPEACDGVDEDCDGVADEGDNGGPLDRPCYGGPDGTAGEGLCHGGTETCTAGGWPQVCAGQVVPGDETCDGADEDCDGSIDEGAAPGAGDFCLPGGVCADVAPECAGAAGWRCVYPDSYEADEERTCDGLDNDCDGDVDEADGCDPCSGVEAPEGWVCVSPTEPEGFVMGSPADEPGRGGDEDLHGVVITRAFLMSATEVTQDSWVAVMGDNPAHFDGCGDCPVESVFWTEAAGYCNALSERDGLEPCYEIEAGRVAWAEGLDCGGYRLPTEAEWEYAARAGTRTAYHSGAAEADLARVGWYSGNSGGRTHPVAGKDPNAWGLYDMHGNVWEWVWDWYEDYGGDAEDPLGPPAGDFRVTRGGSWDFGAGDCRAANRDGYASGYRFDYLGLRPARSVIP